MRVEDLIEKLQKGLESGEFDRQDRIELHGHKELTTVRKNGAGSIVLK